MLYVLIAIEEDILTMSVRSTVNCNNESHYTREYPDKNNLNESLMI